MKKFLHKRWHSIPIGIITAILVVCLLAGSVLAAYTVWTHTSADITVLESIEVLTADDIGEDWSHQDALRFLPEIIHPGVGTCETYLIHNIGPVPITVTVTMTEPAGTEFAGLALVWANSTADVLIGDDGQGGFYYLDKICLNTEAVQILTYTFTIGTYEYAGDLPETPVSGGERYTPEKGDSAYVKVFAGFKVREDAAPGPFTITVTVDRG